MSYPYKASFNSPTSDETLFPKIDPAAEMAGVATTGISTMAVVTAVGQREARQMNYTFPNLDGGGAVNFGLSPVPIQWQLGYVVASYEKRKTFEAKLAKYLKSARRFTLKSEHGDVWDNVQLVRVTHVGKIDRRADAVIGLDEPPWVRELRIDFLWMQPGTTQ